MSAPNGPAYHVRLTSSQDVAPDSPEYAALREAIAKLNTFGARKSRTPMYHVDGPTSWRWACIAAVTTCPTRHGTLWWPDAPAEPEAIVYLGDRPETEKAIPMLDVGGGAG